MKSLVTCKTCGKKVIINSYFSGEDSTIERCVTCRKSINKKLRKKVIRKIAESNNIVSLVIYNVQMAEFGQRQRTANS